MKYKKGDLIYFPKELPHFEEDYVLIKQVPTTQDSCYFCLSLIDNTENPYLVSLVDEKATKLV
jgi:uncharacterized RmlC-like cupin family protein